MTTFAVIHLHNPQETSNASLFSVVETAVSLKLISAAKRRIHNPPEPRDHEALRKAIKIKKPQNLQHIQQHIDTPPFHHEPRVYLIRREDTDGAERCILASGKGSNLITCELTIDPRYIGKPIEGDGNDWSSFETAFGWGGMFLHENAGKGVREWFDLRKVEYSACDADEMVWEAEAKEDASAVVGSKAGG